MALPIHEFHVQAPAAILLCFTVWILYTKSQVLLSFILNIYLQWRYPIRDVSGRKSIPSTRYQFPNGNGDIDKFVHGPARSEQWHRELGPIYRIWNGMKPEVVVSEASAIQTIFKDSDQHAKATNMGSGFLLGELMGMCVGLLNGNAWRTMRKKNDRVFAHSASMTLVPTMLSMTEKHLDEFCASTLKNTQTMDPVEDLFLLPFYMIAASFYGELSEEQVSWLKKWTPHREKLFAYALGGGLARFSVSRYLPTDANKTLKEWLAAWEAFNADAYQISKAKGDHTLLVQLWEDAEEGVVSRKQVLQTIDESLYANLDVGIGIVSWNLVFLACYPDVQAQLLAEIRAETASVGWEKYVQKSDSFLEACISESLRLRPIAAFAVPQSAPTDRVASGYVIPAGTNVTVDAYTLNQRNPFWGADPLSYRPSRWAELKPSQTRYNLWRFGFGPRQCMGKHMASPMVRTVVAKIIDRFELELDGGYSEVMRDSRGLGTHPNVKLRCSQRG